MADARLSTSFRTHPKRVKLQRRMGPVGVLAFIDLILFAAESRTSGTLTGMTAEDVAIAARWEGDTEQFISALLDLRFLDRSDDGEMSMHDWSEHNPFASGSGERKLIARSNAHAGWLKRKGIDCAKKTCELCKFRRSAMRLRENGNAPTPSHLSPLTSLKEEESKTSLSDVPSDEQKYSDASIPLRLAKLLLNEIRGNDPNYKEPNLQKWAESFDRLVRIDKRDPKEIAKLVRWCQRDEFWRANILSASKFREKFGALKLKAEKPAPGTKTPQQERREIKTAPAKTE